MLLAAAKLPTQDNISPYEVIRMLRDHFAAMKLDLGEAQGDLADGLESTIQLLDETLGIIDAIDPSQDVKMRLAWIFAAFYPIPPSVW